MLDAHKSSYTSENKSIFFLATKLPLAKSIIGVSLLSTLFTKPVFICFIKVGFGLSFFSKKRLTNKTAAKIVKTPRIAKIIFS